MTKASLLGLPSLKISKIKKARKETAVTPISLGTTMFGPKKREGKAQMQEKMNPTKKKKHHPKQGMDY